MGLEKFGAAALVAAILGVASLQAAPRLRLSSSTVGPVSIAQGASDPAQTVEAYNAFDGALNLTLSSSVAWITGAVGAQRACTTRSGVCTPLQLALNTAGLPAGMTTGIVTVFDPNAVDAPQTITVTVQIGGAVPANLDLYVAPGGTREVIFSTNSQLGTTVRTNDGGGWLSLALDGTGSFRFSYPYRVHIAPAAGMGQGTYSGTVTTSGSSLPSDNKTIPVTMRVTTQPIALASTDRIRMRLAEGSPASATAVTLSNAGQGTLQVKDAKTAGAAWIAVQGYTVGGLIPDGVVVTLDPKGLAPGTYKDTVTITSNAVAYAGAGSDTTTLTVPVELEIISAGPPVVDYQGVLDNAIFAAGDAISRGDIVAVKGQRLSMAAPAAGSAPPLSTQVSDTQVLLNGVPIPVFYTSYGQINCQIPTDAPVGTALLQVKRTDGQTSNTVSVEINARAPRLLRFNIKDYGAIVNAQDGSYPVPTGAIPGFNTHPARVGDTLILYAIGLGDTSPAVATGAAAPASPLARVIGTPTVNFGGGIAGAVVVPDFVGLSPTSAGLYQVNVRIPAGSPKGDVNLTLAFGDSTSNPVQITVE
ncbi:MAG: IPT/TIG domain-containing protein [Candidatus Solibacter sp.]